MMNIDNCSFDSSICTDEKEFLTGNNALFHYTSSQKCLEGILANNNIRLSIFKNTNDPLEYHNRLIGTTYNTDTDDDTQSRLWDVKNITNELLRNHSFFISFCMNKNKSSGFLDSRMWAQYADNHKGICLVFNKNKIIEVCRSSKQSTASLFNNKISYKADSSSFYRPLAMDLEDAKKTDGSLTNKNFIIKYKRNLFFSKVSDFKGENEYRIIIIDKKSENYIEIPIIDSLAGIITGDRFNTIYYPTLHSLLNSKAIPVYSLKWSAGQFSIKKVNNEAVSL